MISQEQYREYIKEGKFEKFFVEELKEATPEQIKIIGVPIFGEHLPSLDHSHPIFLGKFRRKYGIGPFSTNDKVIMNYINGRVTKGDFYTERLINVEGDRERVLVKKPTFEEAMKEIKRIREQ